MGTVYQNSKTCDVDTKNLQEAKEENEPEIKQEPWYSILRRKIKNQYWIKKFLFSVVFPLLPVWTMLIFRITGGISFEIKEYIETLLAFTVTTSASWVSDMLDRKTAQAIIGQIVQEFGLLLVMCLSAILYSIILLVPPISSELSKVFYNLWFNAFAIILTLTAIVIGVFGDFGGDK